MYFLISYDLVSAESDECHSFNQSITNLNGRKILESTWPPQIRCYPALGLDACRHANYLNS